MSIKQETEDSEMWAEHRKNRQEKKQRNREQSLNILREHGVYFECLSEIAGHYRIGDFDFWPSTGKYMERSTKKTGRGVFNILKKLEIKNNMKKDELILSHVKTLFNVDGTVEYVKKDEAKELLKGAQIILIRMRDKNRGESIIARVFPK